MAGPGLEVAVCVLASFTVRRCTICHLRKALATFGSGPAAELMALALPSLTRYAERHSYEIVVGDGYANGRPPSWGKVPLLQRLLTSYDFVLWIDADALIIDDTVDLETIVPPEAFQAFVVTPSVPGAGIAPCCGVWAFRAGTRAQQFLGEVWNQDDLINHAWWEQAAVMRLTGWRVEYPLSKERPSEWDDGTFFLEEEWDMIPWFPIGYASGKIRHYAGWPSWRLRKFDMCTDLARARGAHLRYWMGLLERRYRPVYQPLRAELRRRTTQVRALTAR